MSDQNPPETSPSRREFVKATSAVAAAGAISFPYVMAHAQDTKKLKIGIVGCGGRGTGAAAQALTADDNCELHAMADLYPEIVDQKEQLLVGRMKKTPEKMNVGSRKFTGLDAYKQVIDSGVDVILLTTPPGFRPMQFEAAIEAGIHAFVEKPCATDIAGVKRFMAAGEKAKSKGISVLCGFCYRYSDHGRELFKRVHNGEIGEIMAIHSTYYTPIVKPMPPEADRPAGMSDTEWQIKNWYNYSWLGGDGIVEQGIHSVDKAMWAMQDQIPKACYAMGGRQKPNNVCNTYDHFGVTYVWDNNVRGHVDWTQFDSGNNIHRENRDYILGTKGQAVFEFKGAEITGENPWKFREPRDPEVKIARNMYQLEHNEFFGNIRKGERHADEEWVARSTTIGLMARMAAYTGQEVTYEGILESGEKLVPDTIDWDAPLPVREMAIPGVTSYPPKVG